MAHIPTEGPDRLVGTHDDDLIDALGGDDKVRARGGNDTVLGGSGDDALYGNYGNDLLVGNTGNDRMYGGDGSDRMIWNNGDGSDLMEGGSGYDVVEVNGADTAGDVFTIAANGDRVAFERTNLGPFSLDIGTTERLEVNGQGGDDVITAGEGLDGLIKLTLDGGAGNDTITGGDGDDKLYGGDGDDVLVGFRGDDRMYGGAGNDRMIWNNGDGSDLMEGGSGYDVVEVNGADTAGDVFTIAADGDRVAFERTNLGPFSLDIGTTERLEVNGQGGDDVITAGEGLDGLIKLALDGGAGNDSITGGDGDDKLYGGWGNDELAGERGDDSMFGGAGNDELEWDNGDGSDLMEGGTGYDTVEVEGSLDQGDTFTIEANGDRVEFARTNLGQFTLDIGTSEKLEVDGAGGDDVIEAGAGLDGLIRLKLDGGAGNDTITGGDGDDAIYGGWGNDVMTGGDGADTFVFTKGSDTVTDFENGTDLVKIAHVPGIESFDDIWDHIEASGGDVVIDFGGDQLTLEDVSLAWIDASDFVFA